jgi:hypothetical protein
MVDEGAFPQVKKKQSKALTVAPPPALPPTLNNRLAIPARWLAGARIFRVPAPAPGDPSDGLGSASQIGVITLSPAGVRALAFFGEWAAVTAMLGVLAANAAVDAVRPGGGGPSAVVGTLAVLAGLAALAKAEADTVAALRRGVRAPLAAGCAFGGGMTAALMARPAWAPDIGLAAGAADASAAIAAVFPELTGAVPPAVLVGVVGAGAAAAAVLLPPAAARAVRSGELACRPPAWGAELLQAGPLQRLAIGAALAAPLLTVLLWCPPTAAVWGLRAGSDAAALAQAGSLVLEGVLLACAARPLVGGHLGAALSVWYTRKHGLTGPAFERPAAAAAAAAAAAVAAPPTTAPRQQQTEAARAGEIARLASRVVLYFAGKAALQAAAPAAILAGCGVAALHGTLAPPGTPGAALARALGLGVGGCAAVVWAACLAWHLLLFRIGFLTDLPSARVGASS